MTERRDVASVIEDMENFLDSLLSHTEETSCTHSVMDLLNEYFNKNRDYSYRNKRRQGPPRPQTNGVNHTRQPHPDFTTEEELSK